MKNRNQKNGKVITLTVSRFIDGIEVTADDIRDALKTAAIVEHSQRRDATAKHWNNIVQNLRTA